jgi:3-phenylpropionate/trans-cinnamate dioxygenase ferredoxin subunit
MSFVEIATVDELKDGHMKMIVIDDHEYLLARVADKYYCTDNRCPHMGGNLSWGKLEGTVVTCLKHHRQILP